MLRKAIKVIAALLALAILAAGGYVAYVCISYHRLPDSDEALEPVGAPAAAGEEYAVVTWNLGFGAYSADYSFFMDGGTESRRIQSRR